MSKPAKPSAEDAAAKEAADKETAAKEAADKEAAAKEAKPYEPSDAEIQAKLREAAGGLSKPQAIQVLKSQHAHNQALGLA